MSLQKGLVGHWTMDDRDTSGGTLYDRSASDAHVTFVGNPTTGVAGRVGQAYTLDGTDDEGTIPLTPSLTIGDTVSVCGWIKTPNANAPSDGNSMPFHECQDSNNRGWRLGVENGVAEWGIYGSDGANGFTELNGNTAIDDDSWHFLVGTYDGANMIVYVDGVEDASTTQAGLSPPNRDPTIGVRAPGTGYFGGEVEEVRVYNRPLSADEVNALYQMRSHRTQMNTLDKQLVGHWTMDDVDTQGTTLSDSSSFDNDMTLNNSPTTGVSGQVGEAYSFNGTNSFLSTTIDTGKISDSFSMSIWVKRGTSGTFEDIFSTLGDFTGITVRKESSDSLMTILDYQDGTDSGEMENYILPDDAWHHIVITWSSSSGEYNLYADAQTEHTVATGIGKLITETPNDLTVATSDPAKTDEIWSGDLDDFRIYSRVLSADEVNKLYNKRE